MNGSQENPWADRWSPLLSREEIRKRAELRPEPITVTEYLTAAAASEAIQNALDGLFYPSELCLDILIEWVGLAHAHCLRYFKSPRAFLEGVYEKTPPLPDFYFPLCLTGLSGVGKSALLKALSRIAPPQGTVLAEDGTRFPLQALQVVTIKASNTPKQLLEKLSHQCGSIAGLVDATRKLAYRNGWSLLCLDEFQFVTQSENANTRIVQMLMSMCYLGMPTVYIANFSLLHKLSARNQEDTQRLLGDVRLVVPESHHSDDWRTLLKWQKEIAPDVFLFDPESDAERMHFLTAGVKRVSAKLLKIAFVHACRSGRPVRMAELEAAYNAVEFASFRKDVELLHQIGVEHRHIRKDLQCPLDISTNASTTEQWRQQRQQRVDEAAVHAALTEDERSNLAKRQQTAKFSDPKPRKATVIPIGKGLTPADQMKSNLAWFLDKI